MIIVLPQFPLKRKGFFSYFQVQYFLLKIHRFYNLFISTLNTKLIVITRQLDDLKLVKSYIKRIFSHKPQQVGSNLSSYSVIFPVMKIISNISEDVLISIPGGFGALYTRIFFYCCNQ